MLKSYILRDINIQNLDEDLIPNVEFLDKWYNLPSDHPAREARNYLIELLMAHENVLRTINALPRIRRTKDERKLKKISEKEVRWLEKYF